MRPAPRTCSLKCELGCSDDLGCVECELDAAALRSRGVPRLQDHGRLRRRASVLAAGRCLVDDDCTDGGQPICHPDTKQCSECAIDDHCPAAAPVYDKQTSDCEQCLVDGHCEGDELCGGDHKCHFTCSTNLDCENPDRPLCSDGDCVECLANTDCAAPSPSVATTRSASSAS